MNGFGLRTYIKIIIFIFYAMYCFTTIRTIITAFFLGANYTKETNDASACPASPLKNANN